MIDTSKVQSVEADAVLSPPESVSIAGTECELISTYSDVLQKQHASLTVYAVLGDSHQLMVSCVTVFSAYIEGAHFYTPLPRSENASV